MHRITNLRHSAPEAQIAARVLGQKPAAGCLDAELDHLSQLGVDLPKMFRPLLRDRVDVLGNLPVVPLRRLRPYPRPCEMREMLVEQVSELLPVEAAYRVRRLRHPLRGEVGAKDLVQPWLLRQLADKEVNELAGMDQNRLDEGVLDDSRVCRIHKGPRTARAHEDLVANVSQGVALLVPATRASGHAREGTPRSRQT